MTSWTRRSHGAQDGMLPSPGRAARPPFKGKPPRKQLSPAINPRSGAPYSAAPLPRRGKQRRIRTPAAPLAPPGQGSVAQRAAGDRLLLMSLLPSAPTPAPSETPRSLPAPGAWGRQASPPRRRHCPPAPPAHLPKNHRRRQAPAREPVAVCSHTRPKRNAPQPACPRRMGQTGVTPAPTALSAGTADPPPQKPPQTTGSCS